MSTKQCTVAAPMNFSGRGLHTGVKTTINVLPAQADSGIIFKRIDLDGQPIIEALCDNVKDTSRGTVLEKNGAKVSTIEHLMAALWSNGVDNAVIEIDAPEVPIMDGSSREYCKAIAKVGVQEQDVERVYYEVAEKTTFSIPEKGVLIEIYPDTEFSVSVHIDYNSKVLGCQYASYSEGDDFSASVGSCRTFVFLHEIEPLLEMNLIKGGDLDNAIVIVENLVSATELERLNKLFNKTEIRITNGYVNNLELRYSNEPARHKLLDVLGDFALLGRRIKGRVIATRPGHFANSEMVKLLRKSIKRDANKPKYPYNPLATPIYDINQIKGLLPHRPPFLLVDRIIHIDHHSVGGIKNVTMNEPFFVGHFPDEPVMPGVLIVEAMAQCGGILALHNLSDPENYSTYFLKIDGVRFKRKVVPGDTLQFELQLLEPIRRGIVLMEARAYVAGQLACEAVLMAQVAKN